MQSNDSNNDLDNLPSLSLSDDERNSRVGTQQIKPKKLSKKKPTNAGSSTTGTSRKVIILLIVTILLLTAGGAWQIDTLHTQLKKTQAQMTQMVSQMDQITGSIATSGKTTLQTTGQLSHQVVTIAQTQKKLSQVNNEQSKQLSSLQSVTDNNKKDIANLKWRNKLDSSAQDKETKKIKTLSSDISDLTHQIKVINANQLSTTTTWQTQLEQLNTQLKKQQDSFANSEKQDKTGAIDEKLTHLDSALKSMDNYRLQINRRLLQLGNSVRELQKNGN